VRGTHWPVADELAGAEYRLEHGKARKRAVGHADCDSPVDVDD
jgi:hypothetical protein